MPVLSGIDHVHVYVSSWREAEAWYKNVLGFSRMEAFSSWSMYFHDPLGNYHEITTYEHALVAGKLS